MHIENIKKVVECLAQRIREEFDKGTDNINVEEMGMAIDMLKDMTEALYKSEVVKAMENPITADISYDWNDDPARLTMDILGSKKMKSPEWSNPSMYSRYDGRGMNYYGRVGHQDGGYRMNRPMDFAYHDDHMMDDKMYTQSYSDGYQAGLKDSQPDYRQGHSGNKRMTFMVSKEIHNGNTADDVAKNSEKLDEYLAALWEDMEELSHVMTANEKATLKSKMNAMIAKIA